MLQSFARVTSANVVIVIVLEVLRSKSLVVVVKMETRHFQNPSFLAWAKNTVCQKRRLPKTPFCNPENVSVLLQEMLLQNYVLEVSKSPSCPPQERGSHWVEFLTVTNFSESFSRALAGISGKNPTALTESRHCRMILASTRFSLRALDSDYEHDSGHKKGETFQLRCQICGPSKRNPYQPLHNVDSVYALADHMQKSIVSSCALVQRGTQISN